MSRRQATIDRIEQARQHQEMQVRYPAYSEFRDWFNQKIAALNGDWYKLSLDMDSLQQLRGQRAAFQEIKDNLDAMHRMDIGVEMKRLEEDNETV